MVGGDVGGEIGAAMRRGIIAVGGSCGDAAGFNMIAGTILVFGTSGIRIGAGMRRGTIGLLGPGPPTMLPTFRKAGCFRPLFLQVLLRELARLGFRSGCLEIVTDLLLYHGDLLAVGKGEVWMQAS
jgi:formylmethanofuran dehydrogenase subunit C